MAVGGAYAKLITQHYIWYLNQGLQDISTSDREAVSSNPSTATAPFSDPKVRL